MPFTPRKFQQENLDLARAIRLRERQVPRVLNNVTPGGGKSSLPPIYASQLIPHHIDKVAWFTPRDNLRTQGEEIFEDHDLRVWLRHSHRIRAAGNETDPSRGTAGYVTTHQALAQNPELHVQEFQNYRYALFIDEVHHILDGSGLARMFQALIDRARLVVLMTGTLARNDRGRVAFVPYRIREDGREVPDLAPEPSTGCTVITYTRQNALADRALLPIVFSSLDMKGKWEKDGEHRTIQSFDDTAIGAGANDALETALATPFALEVLDRCARDWLGYRRDNRFAQMLIVASGQPRARKYQQHVQSKYGIQCEVATIDEGCAARGAIKQLRSRSLSAISTVGMAYEGMDAPGVTHIAALNRYRSVPWIEQMLARGTRVDRLAGPWAQQRCYAYVPDDPIMRSVIAQIEAEQGPYLRSERDPRPGQEGPEVSDVIPLAGMFCGLRSSELGGDALDRDTTEINQTIIDQHDMTGRMTPLLFEQMMRARQGSGAQPATSVIELVTTVSEEEDGVRRYLQEKCARVDRSRSCPWGTTNGDLIRHFRKSREAMNLAELRQCKAYVDARYPGI